MNEGWNYFQMKKFRIYFKSVHSRVLDVRFWLDHDHSTWNSNLYTVYVLKFLYRHFLKNRGNKTCSRCVRTWKIFVISLSPIQNWKWEIIFGQKFMFVMSWWLLWPFWAWPGKAHAKNGKETFTGHLPGLNWVRRLNKQDCILKLLKI